MWTRLAAYAAGAAAFFTSGDKTRSIRGNVAVAMAVALPAVVGAAGFAVDIGKVYVAQNALQTAVDAAALAGSMELPYDPDLELGVVEAAANDMLHENYAEAEMTSIVPGSEVRSVCLSAEAEVEMSLMGVLGVEDQTVEASACAGFNNLEIALVLDTTGSMKGSPIENVKMAAEELVELIMPDNSTPSSMVGMVPFRGMVRLEADVDGEPAGCRNMDGTLNDGSLRDEYKDKQYRNPKNDRLRVSSDTCGSISVTKALDSDKDALLSAISALGVSGNWSGTIIGEGVKWGRELLTPEAPFTEAHDDEDYRKIMIVLTDGDTEDGRCGGRYAVSYTPNNYWTNAFFGVGLGGTYADVDDIPTCADGDGLNQQILDEAQAAKDEGIEIFSIRYGTSDDTDIAVMKEIASSKEDTDDHYFSAPSSDDIGDVFKKIGRQLGMRLLPMNTAMGEDEGEAQ